MANLHIQFTPDIASSLYKYHSSLIAFLVMPPHIEFVHKHLIPQIDYLNSRSGETLTILLIGYHQEPEYYLSDLNPGQFKNLESRFSTELFCRQVKELEEMTSWEYSGAAELLLLNVIDDPRNTKEFMAVPIEEIAEKFNERFVRSIFETIIRNAETDKLSILLLGSVKGMGKQNAIDILSLLLPTEYRKYATLGKIKIEPQIDPSLFGWKSKQTD